MKFVENNDVIISKYDNRKIFFANHAITRFLDKQRFSDFAGKEEFQNKIYWVVENGIRKILSECEDYSSIYVIHSRSTGIGVVINWRKDTQNFSDKRNHAIIMTVLPIASTHYVKDDNDIPLIVENQLYLWAKEDVEENKKREVLKEKAMYEHTIASSDDDLIVHLWEGKYYDSNVEEIIIVE